MRRDSGSVVTWRRAEIVVALRPAAEPDQDQRVVSPTPDTVREGIHNFNRDGFKALYPRYAGGRPLTFTLPQRREIKKIALGVPTDLGRPFATWSLAKLADHLVAEGVVTDISHEGPSPVASRGRRLPPLDGTDRPAHATQARLLRRYIAWRDCNADNAKLHALVDTTNVA